MNSLSNAMVVEDCKKLLDFAASQPFASDGAVGCTGYCMSGPFAFSVAAKLADRVKASASFHGVRLCIDTMDSPHLDADKIQGEMYFGMAETDDWAPPEMVEALDKHMQTTGANYRIEWYPAHITGLSFHCAKESTTKNQQNDITNDCLRCSKETYKELKCHAPDD